MNLQKFTNREFGTIRTMERDGEIWFVAKDVCDVLKISNYRDALLRLSKKQKGVATTDTPGGRQKMNFINESGLYKLAFTSRKPEAEKFTEWVTSEVLPSIRKTGSYSTKPTNTLDMFEMAVNAMREQEKEISEVKENQRILEARMNNFDNLTLEDKREKLRNMVNRYAYDNGLDYGSAWRTFRRFYNQAFDTNLKLKIRHYKAEFGLKNLTTPEYFERTNTLEDALRVADKMLNTEMV